MSERTSEAQRVDFYRRHVRGQTYGEIAQSCGISLECVRYWCHKQQRGEGVKSHWHLPMRGILSHFDPEVSQKIQQLREEHPGWGPVSVQLHLKQDPALRWKVLPSLASIGRFLHQDPANRRRPQLHQPQIPAVRLSRVHQRWQIDFKVQIHLTDGQTVQLHTVTDPYSGAHIGAYLYPSGPTTSRVPLGQVQATLRACFQEWGTLPAEIQTDGEPILVGAGGERATVFTLWLAGLGVIHRTTSPSRPTQNGSVERGHRTLDQYCLQGQLHRCLPDLQRYLTDCRGELNMYYPSRAKGCGGKPPLLVHPELYVQPVRYRVEWEEGLFDLARVDQFLAAHPLIRKVNKTGQITIGGAHQVYFVGHRYSRQFVHIRFDPSTREFVASLPHEVDPSQEIKRWPARHLNQHDLLWPGEPVPIHCPQQLLLPSILRSKKVYC